MYDLIYSNSGRSEGGSQVGWPQVSFKILYYSHIFKPPSLHVPNGHALSGSGRCESPNPLPNCWFCCD